MDVTGFGTATTAYSNQNNTDNCINYSNDLSLVDLSYCGDILYDSMRSSIISNCATGSPSCIVNANTGFVSSLCPQSIVVNDMYLTYSCYGNFIFITIKILALTQRELLPEKYCFIFS